MDLPVDAWSIIREKLSHKDWAKACGASRASYALRRPLVVAELCGEMDNNEKVATSLLQMERWPTCHSLIFNLSLVHEAAGLTVAQVEQISQAALPWLQCLHILGRGSVALDESSIEGQLVRSLARHASVLTLQVKTISMPIYLPTLQHLVLNLDPSSLFWVGDKLSMLKGLKSLFLQSRVDLLCTDGGMDLSACLHLQAVAVQGVRLKGTVSLPAGCALHAINASNHVHEVTPDVADLVSGLTLRHSVSQNCFGVRFNGTSMWSHKWLNGNAPTLQNLTRLQLNLSCEGFDEQSKEESELWLLFVPDQMPNLEVLDLDVQFSLRVVIDPRLPLKSLVLVAAGTLQMLEIMFGLPEVSPPEVTTLRQMYIQSGAAFLPRYRAEMEAMQDTAQPWTGARLLERVREEQDSWTAQMPAGFQPGDLQQCCCGACPDCLVRAGVPVLCEQAWTRDGYDEHLRPRYAAAPERATPCSN